MRGFVASLAERPDVCPQRDRESDFRSRDRYLVNTGSARWCSLARFVCSQARAALRTSVAGTPDSDRLY